MRACLEKTAARFRSLGHWTLTNYKPVYFKKRLLVNSSFWTIWVIKQRGPNGNNFTVLVARRMIGSGSDGAPAVFQ